MSETASANRCEPPSVDDVGVVQQTVDGVGHQAPPRSTWDIVVPAILQHTAR